MTTPDQQTMDYYDRNAASFVVGTVNADMYESLTLNCLATKR